MNARSSALVDIGMQYLGISLPYINGRWRIGDARIISSSSVNNCTG